ncbi:MAG: hypothetical protein JO066_11510 [Verrucomicrobia bacterium]|nr:hypothetical protein [Verrucomicrobiota bacterium]
MNPSTVDEIANAVLYEGYILYPYRASSRKNRQRFTFGRVYPQAYSEAQNGKEPFAMQTECLLRSRGETTTLRVRVRFLHPVARTIGLLVAPLSRLPADIEPTSLTFVPEVRVHDRLYQSWQEAVEREVRSSHQTLQSLANQTLSIPFHFSSSLTFDPIQNCEIQKIVGAVVRRQQSLQGTMDIAVQPLTEEVFKIKVTVRNQTSLLQAELPESDEVLMRTFASTHTILESERGEFFSLIDPPESYAEAAATCSNIGTWPVLVGEREKGEASTILSSPIILYDFPEIAPESPGEFFDGTEIDEILALRVLTMTDQEKWEMGQLDEHARQILNRTEALPKEDFWKMHGTIRNNNSSGEDFFDANTRLESVTVRGTALTIGHRVRIKPQGRADVMDLALEGKIAMIESIEQDAENRVYLALVLEEDPGKDLGMLRQPGHRFFYGLHEIEPLIGEL